jgi:predicted PurR-regulated permease PerM
LTGESSSLFLGIIAFATAVMAVVQVGAILVVVRLARRVDQLSGQIQREIGPLAARLTAVADNLQQASSLAAVQVERVDRLLSSVTSRAEETMSAVQSVIVGPLREGLAVVAALRGVVAAFRSFRGTDGRRGASRFDDEDPLFIG